ncbi:MAG: ATP-binding protein [Bdellovibrionota bacterium]
MFRSALFRKHFAIAALCVLGFAFAGSYVTQQVVHRMMDQRERENNANFDQNRSDPAVFFARLIDTIAPNDPLVGMKKLDSLFRAAPPPLSFALINSKGEAIYKIGNSSIPKIELNSLGKEPYSVSQDFKQEERGEPFAQRSGLIRLNSPQPFYLYFEHKRPPFGPHPFQNGGPNEFRPEHPPGPPKFFLFPFFISVVMVLCGIACALYLIFRSLRANVATADQVISELQSGNLKARFPIRKNDEIGRAMERFNLMASEIEKLVERLRSSEQSRNFLLQELTHDLRTPVASLQNLLDTIFSQVPMKDSIRELSELATKEVDYISRLVEDLLLLAQVSEPKYRAPEKPVDVVALVEEEAEAVGLRYSGKIKLEVKSSVEEALVFGDERLLKRLTRNALENAFSFAAQKVEIKIDRIAENLRVLINDDGAGFSAEALKHFGERRSQRTIAPSHQGRLSLGLGSVIMKTVIALHGGQLEAENRPEGGATVEILLPIGL